MPRGAQDPNLLPWQWILIMAAILGAGSGVTVFAFQTFEAKGSASAVEDSLRKDLRRHDRKLDAILLRFNIPQPMPAEEEE
jgi:hypothetical protein